jgi:hypothetical protein
MNFGLSVINDDRASHLAGIVRNVGVIVVATGNDPDPKQTSKGKHPQQAEGGLPPGNIYPRPFHSDVLIRVTAGGALDYHAFTLRLNPAPVKG